MRLALGLGLNAQRLPLFSPASLFAGGVAGGWWDSSDPTTLFTSTDDATPVAAVTDAVGQWKDKSGNANHLTEATNKPTWQGSNGVRFDGSNDILSRASSLGLYAAGACSAFMVFKPNPAVNARIFAEGRSTNNNPLYNPAMVAAAVASTATAVIRDDLNNFLTTGSTVMASAFTNTKVVFGVIDTGVSITGYLNGSAGTPVTYTRSGTVTVDRFALGGMLRGAASNFFAMDAHEVVIVGRAVTSTERAAVEQYLRSKWAV